MRSATVYPDSSLDDEADHGLNQLRHNRDRYRLSAQDRRRRRILSMLSIGLAMMGVIIITLGALLASRKKPIITDEPTTSTIMEIPGTPLTTRTTTARTTAASPSPSITNVMTPRQPIDPENTATNSLVDDASSSSTTTATESFSVNTSEKDDPGSLGKTHAWHVSTDKSVADEASTTQTTTDDRNETERDPNWTASANENQQFTKST